MQLLSNTGFPYLYFIFPWLICGSGYLVLPCYILNLQGYGHLIFLVCFSGFDDLHMLCRMIVNGWYLPAFGTLALSGASDWVSLQPSNVATILTSYVWKLLIICSLIIVGWVFSKKDGHQFCNWIISGPIGWQGSNFRINILSFMFLIKLYPCCSADLQYLFCA